MTNRKNLHLAPRGLIAVLTVSALSGLAGCSSLSSLSDAGKIDYRSASKNTTKSLEVPPDLTQLRRDNRYAIPEGAPGVGTGTTASSFNAQGGQPVPAMAGANVTPKATPQMRIERSGNQRYLVVKQAPEALWPQLKDFWQDNGFLVNVEQPQTGVMETDWAENRAKIPQDFLRNTIGKVLDSLYSTSERDKFRTRLERGADGSTEIYISHRGAQEVLTGILKDNSTWTARPSDPELEAEFLARLMTRLGAEGPQARQAVASASTAAVPQRAKLVAGDPQYVEVDEEFERAWRRVGLALDRVGFTVEDRDRTLGLYFVRYLDDDMANAEANRGFFSRLFFYDGKDKSKATKYRILVKGAGNNSHVTVLNEEGKPEKSVIADKILKLLNDQLK